MTKLKTQGFTLLEVMVALTIFAISALVLLEQSSRSASQSSRLEAKVMAVWVAENEMAELRLSKKFPATGTVTKIVDFANRDWDLSREVTDTANDSLRRVDVRVSVKDGEDYSALLTGFVGEH